MNYQETQVVVPDSDAGQEIQAGTVAVVLLWRAHQLFLMATNV